MIAPVDTDPNSLRRRMATAETYSAIAAEYERKGRTEDAARCDRIVARCVQGV